MLALEGLHKTFRLGGGWERPALRGVDLVLQEGEFATLIGPNGAGKSTLLNAVAGTFRVDAGTVRLDGQDVTRWPEHRRARLIGRVFQDPLRGTAASLTVEENLAMARARGRRRSLRLAVRGRERRLFAEWLEALGLGLADRLKQPVGLLSGGQRQALALVMAAVTRPRLLLLDEHTAALDPAASRQVLDLTCRLVAEHGLTVLMVTHNMEQALRVGSRTLMMQDGRVVLDLRGDDRRRMGVEGLVERFARVRGQRLVEDRLLLG
ncbi:ABC transporter ATP-binding protein [Limnochorda pilosa]|uniref:ABC transporter ATP-binding protein n=1 Tax=Limnochorda pilosa TaxID=1555112 RepID=A0A0K2SNX0_LIMPI|nr:ATP-binding cassette domain-containing protein [Limnochorda pilosa]BAS28529.1 ABC transporter ATP-binding protein [Limnochorda pilosa]